QFPSGRSPPFLCSELIRSPYCCKNPPHERKNQAELQRPVPRRMRELFDIAHRNAAFRLQNCDNRPVRQRKRYVPLRGSTLFGGSDESSSEARDKRRRINDNFDLCSLKLEFNLSP